MENGPKPTGFVPGPRPPLAEPHVLLPDRPSELLGELVLQRRHGDVRGVGGHLSMGMGSEWL